MVGLTEWDEDDEGAWWIHVSKKIVQLEKSIAQHHSQLSRDLKKMYFEG